MEVNRLELVEKYLDWITVVHSMKWRQNKRYNKANWVEVMKLIPKAIRNYRTIYKMLNWYLRRKWEEFTISKDDYLARGLPWWNTSKCKVYLMDKYDKLLFKADSRTQLRRVFQWPWDIDDIYSQIKRRNCPDLAYVIEESFYWEQYEVLVD